MRKLLLNIVLALGLMLPVVALPATAMACPGGNSPKGQALQGVGGTGSECNSNGVKKLISAFVNILSYVAGAIAVIMIIVAGFKYITSGGDANKVTNAKGTLIYALIGVAIAALAQFLVRFVLTVAKSAG